MSRDSKDPRRGPAPRKRTGRVRAATAAAWIAGSFLAGLGSAALARQAWSARERTAPAVGAPSPEAERRFQRGVEALEAERTAAALEEFRAASRLDPTDPRPHHGMGKVHEKLFLRDQAEEAYRAAIRADPGYRPSKESLAMLLHEKGRYQEAIDLLRKLEAERPDPFIDAELAINALALGRTTEAIALLEKYNAAKGKQAWGFTHLGRAYAAAGRSREAEAAYREALAADPRFTLAHYGLGQLLVATGRRAESEPILAEHRRLRALETELHEARMGLLQEPDAVGALVRLARAQFLLGKARESLATLERARRAAPGDPRLVELQEKVSRSLPPAGALPGR